MDFELIRIIIQLITVIICIAFICKLFGRTVCCSCLNPNSTIQRPPPHPTPTSDAVPPPPGAQMNQVFDEPDPIQLFNLQRLNYPQMPAQPLSYSPPRSYSSPRSYTPPPSYIPPPSYSSLSIKIFTDV